MLSLIDFYDLRNRVKLLWHISNIEEILQQNHLLVLPSLSEGLPIAIIEAMTAGRPCLVTDVGDSALLILENKTGWVSTACSVNALDNALEKAWEQQSNWMKMGEQAKKVSSDFIEKNAGETFFLQLTNGS